LSGSDWRGGSAADGGAEGGNALEGVGETVDPLGDRVGQVVRVGEAEAVRGDKPLHEVERMTREVTLGAATAYDFHTRLLPQLRQIAQARLERSGRPMSPETLGRWWELLRPDRPAPEDRHAPGISPRELRALVSDLEKM